MHQVERLSSDQGCGIRVDRLGTVGGREVGRPGGVDVGDGHNSTRGDNSRIACAWACAMPPVPMIPTLKTRPGADMWEVPLVGTGGDPERRRRGSGGSE